MRLLCYNILDGADADADARRRDALLRWIAAQRADVVGLAELNGWHRPGVFETRRKAAGYDHGAILRHGPSDYKLGVLTRRPLQIVHPITQGVHHGILHVRTDEVDVLCTHFSPTDPDLRVREAERCVALITAVPGPAVLMGDLNSHSPADAELVAAFTTPTNRDWATDYRPHEVLRSAGLIDLGEHQPDRWTTATALNPDEPRRRLDFIYVNQAYVETLGRPAAAPIRDTRTDHLSDHYPVVAG